MSPDPVVLFAMVVVLLPMGYFLLAAPAFLLVRLDIPQVAELMRVMFNGYFLTMMVTGAVGMLAFALDGRLLVALGIGLIVALAAVSRRWFLRRIDAQLPETDPGDAAAARRLRRLHWEGMLYNAVQVVVIVGCIPYIAVA
jgi:hypothetical protein